MHVSCMYSFFGMDIIENTIFLILEMLILSFVVGGSKEDWLNECVGGKMQPEKIKMDGLVDL